MAKSTRNRRLYPNGTEDGLTFKERGMKSFLRFMTPEDADRASEKICLQMEALVEAGHCRRIITPAGVAAYAPTPAFQAHLEAGGRHPLEGGVSIVG